MKHLKNHFASTALLLQGGGALGSYQAGVYQALSEAGIEPDCVAGISIGAINAALIAGNSPEKRLDRLREFWDGVTLDDFHFAPPVLKYLLTQNKSEMKALDIVSALRTLFFGIPGFFTMRPMTHLLAPKSSPSATSFCDTGPLRATLERLGDFDRINKGDMQFTVGATQVTSGNFIRFDNEQHTITADHIMASGALPPGLPAVEIDGERYWDGGLISNTPLQGLLESKLTKDTLVFQVDLWCAEGKFPENIAEVYTREKDIQFSSRTRSNTDRFREKHNLYHHISELLKELPDKLKNSPHAKALAGYSDENVYNIVHLIYHNKGYEGYTKDFEFSRLSMEMHWKSGYEDTLKTLAHPEVLQRPHNKEGIGIFDFSRESDAKNTKAMKNAA
jgi:NTE family protein